MLLILKYKFLPALSAFITTAVFSVSAAAFEVVPSGECVGVKLYTDGLIVTDTATVTERDGSRKNPAKGCDIRRGDVIKQLNGTKLLSNDMLIEMLRTAQGDITLTVSRGGKERHISVSPADTADGPKLGLWLRDSTAGMGTVTCYVGDRFAALGHGICDIDSGNIMPVAHGIIQGSRITAVTRSENGLPGAITGEINGEFLGSVTANRENGLFGRSTSSHSGTAVEVAKKAEVRRGGATILADIDGCGVKEYAIEINRVAIASDGRDMVITVTDPTLLEKTGGIVQGMSGAPIIQNGKLAGAVTHVFVNDTRSGYAIFAENLLRDMM